MLVSSFTGISRIVFNSKRGPVFFFCYYQL